MSYTHYYKRPQWTKDDKEGYNKALPFVKEIIEEHKDILALEYNEPAKKPVATQKEIRFNGIGVDDGHETFYFSNSKRDFSFCKTARKPYDLPVCKILMVLKHFCPSLLVGSEGYIIPEEDSYPDNWPEAHLWCSERLPGYKIPKEVY